MRKGPHSNSILKSRSTLVSHLDSHRRWILRISCTWHAARTVHVHHLFPAQCEHFMLSPVSATPCFLKIHLHICGVAQSFSSQNIYSQINLHGMSRALRQWKKALTHDGGEFNKASMWEKKNPSAVECFHWVRCNIWMKMIQRPSEEENLPRKIEVHVKWWAGGEATSCRQQGCYLTFYFDTFSRRWMIPNTPCYKWLIIQTRSWDVQ